VTGRPMPHGPAHRDLVSIHRDHPVYPPDAFDPDGYLIVEPDYICPPHRVHEAAYAAHLAALEAGRPLP
jgi:hypothetical protein